MKEIIFRIVILPLIKRYFKPLVMKEFPTETKRVYPVKERCHCGGIIERTDGDAFYKYKYSCNKCDYQIMGGGYNLYLLDLHDDILSESCGGKVRTITEIKLSMPIHKRIN